jgi:hypothetical protein
MPKSHGLKISAVEAVGYLPSSNRDRFAQVFEQVFAHGKVSVEIYAPYINL